MKRNLFRLSTFLLCLSFCVLLAAQERKPDPSVFAGDWSFTVSGAPDGYEKGTAKFFLEENQLKGEFKLGDSTLRVNAFTEKPEGYICTVYIESYPFEILLTHAKGEFLGRADDGSQYYAISFKKMG
jgi:hypothetical protein